ncbi:hypothetical protein H1P_2100005 [Hyella patelloides LEGE 07179]|uniref:CBM2 domain-containing protein n=1 Tax=Hyella patelloides LEGE 07179 TaxID=945734 RepID=A0A563VQC6_9CYAN|nr:cellulose binding domain-containing protein [Hyella patelloides]VEP13672.1 hypothetical protein H1P_2100005 [Hyella patelloides LEGE 07179]
MNGIIENFELVNFHFDGNNNDPDDISALPVAALLADGANIQEKTTFRFGNNLAEPNEDSKLARMRTSAAYAEKLGIDTVDYQANISSTIDGLVNDFNSGKKVLSIEGGPMEATYRALARTSPENRQNITLLSHSSWNENRDVVTRDGVEEARTWSDLKQDFPEVEYIDIGDQNARFRNDNWNWLRDSNEEVYNDAWERMESSGVPNDPSDAGMLFYALTGDQNADPFDARSFLETNIPSYENSPSPTPTPEPPTTDSEIDLDFDVVSQWEQGFKGEISFTNNGEYFEKWKVGFDAPFNIEEIQDAVIESSEGDSYVIGDVRSNDNVYAGETTTFEFTASVDDSSDFTNPTNFTFNGQDIDVDPAEFDNIPSPSKPDPTGGGNSDSLIDVDIKLVQDSLSGNGVSGTVSFENNGDYFKGWTLGLDMPVNVTSAQNAEFENSTEDNIIFKDVRSNDDVYSGEITEFTFTGVADGELTADNVVFNGSEIPEIELAIVDNS